MNCYPTLSAKPQEQELGKKSRMGLPSSSELSPVAGASPNKVSPGPEFVVHVTGESQGKQSVKHIRNKTFIKTRPSRLLRTRGTKKLL